MVRRRGGNTSTRRGRVGFWTGRVGRPGGWIRVDEAGKDRLESEYKLSLRLKKGTLWAAESPKAGQFSSTPAFSLLPLSLPVHAQIRPHSVWPRCCARRRKQGTLAVFFPLFFSTLARLQGASRVAPSVARTYATAKSGSYLASTLVSLVAQPISLSAPPVPILDS